MKLSSSITYQVTIVILVFVTMFANEGKAQSLMTQEPNSSEVYWSEDFQTTPFTISAEANNNYKNIDTKKSLEVRVVRNLKLKSVKNFNLWSYSVLTNREASFSSNQLKYSIINNDINLGFDPKGIRPLPKMEDLQKFTFIKINIFKK